MLKYAALAALLSAGLLVSLAQASSGPVRADGLSQATGNRELRLADKAVIEDRDICLAKAKKKASK